VREKKRDDYKQRKQKIVRDGKKRREMLVNNVGKQGKYEKRVYHRERKRERLCVSVCVSEREARESERELERES
jgi:hypothetical protein